MGAPAWPRTYPRGFALQVVKARHVLLDDKELPVTREVACLLLQQKHMCPLAFCFEAPSDLKLGEIFEEGAFEDCWLDAHMDRVVSYLRADRHLDLPDVLRELFPSHIPPQRP